MLVISQNNISKQHYYGIHLSALNSIKSRSMGGATNHLYFLNITIHFLLKWCYGMWFIGVCLDLFVCFGFFLYDIHLPPIIWLQFFRQKKKTKTHGRRVLLNFSILAKLPMKFRTHSSFKEKTLQQKQAGGIEA